MQIYVTLLPKVLLVCSLVLGSYCKPTAPIDQKPIPVTAPDLMAEYIRDTPSADSKYKGKKLLVSGVLVSVKPEEATLILKGANSMILNGVECSAIQTPENKEEFRQVVVGQGIIVEGDNHGWESAYGVLRLKQCKIIGK
jgi:hypothetical protein